MQRVGWSLLTAVVCLILTSCADAESTDVSKADQDQQVALIDQTAELGEDSVEAVAPPERLTLRVLGPPAEVPSTDQTDGAAGLTSSGASKSPADDGSAAESDTSTAGTSTSSTTDTGSTADPAPSVITATTSSTTEPPAPIIDEPTTTTIPPTTIPPTTAPTTIATTPAPTTTVPTTTTTTTTPTTTTTTTTRPPPSTNPPGGSVSLQRELVTELNRRRADMGLGRVSFSQALADESGQCAQRSLDNGVLNHCGHEVLWMGAAAATADELVDAWFRSPLHKQALTYGTSTEAGGAMVVDPATGRAVAAITIDY